MPKNLPEHWWTCNRLDLQTLESQPVMPKNLPDHWSKCSQAVFGPDALPLRKENNLCHGLLPSSVPPQILLSWNYEIPNKRKGTLQEKRQKYVTSPCDDGPVAWPLRNDTTENQNVLAPATVLRCDNTLAVIYSLVQQTIGLVNSRTHKI